MTQLTAVGESQAQTPMARRVLQRLILPVDGDPDVMTLYADAEAAVLDADKFSVGSSKEARNLNHGMLRQSTSTGRQLPSEDVLSRHSFRLISGQRVSLGSYFNAFPASYWRKWTVVKNVRLTVTVKGEGASVIVYRSMANGRSQRVDSAEVPKTVEHSTDEHSMTFDLSLTPFQDGGWYWFDLMAGQDDAVLVNAVWDAEVPAHMVQPKSATIGITTMNRPDFCAALIEQVGQDPEIFALIDEIIVAEQGTKKVTDDPGYPAAETACAGKLRIIEQANLGGSGGFARAQLETLAAGKSDYVLFLDDDIELETESILRSIVFADLCRRPSIVGGHMFSLFRKAQLHSFGEIVNRYRFWWQSAVGVQDNWDFSDRNLRSSRWLHRRVDTDFNPWFFCLIPTQVIREIGLSLPLFIKWDDSEYGLRAQSAGYPTISLPGAAVWHVPWTDKNDALDWQAYFHQRNRFVAALLHSPFKHGGRMVQESFNHQVRHLISMQYSTCELRLKALEDVLAGPERLHKDLPTKLGEVRALRSEFTDAQTQSDPDAFPPVRQSKPRRREFDDQLKGRASQLKSAVLGTLRQFRPVRPLSREFPESALAAQDSFWWVLAAQDSTIFSMPDGTSAALYQRDPQKFKELLKRTMAIHRQMYTQWLDLAQTYRDALPEVTSVGAWAQTFAPDGEQAGSEQ